MDPERQPLLNPNSDVRNRRYRPLTSEEVIRCRQDVHWRRAKFCVKFFFWAILAMLLSIIACLLVQAPSCNSFASPTVPPVHMTFAPLISTSRLNDVKDGKANGVYELAWFN